MEIQDMEKKKRGRKPKSKIILNENPIFDSTEEIQDYINVDEDLIKEYVKVNPYPEYETMLEKIKHNIDLEMEYGELNHEFCKVIYENPNDENLIIEMGKKIYKRGGIQALLMNFNVIKYYSPYWQSKINSIKFIKFKYIFNYRINIINRWLFIL